MRISARLLTLLALAPLVLAACGGSSGGESTAGGPSGNNLPPIIEGKPTTTLAAGTSYSFTPSAADPDGDKLTFLASNLPGWAKIDANSGAVTGTPTEADVGMSGSIVIEVTDSKASAQLPAFRIQVASNVSAPVGNSPPTIAGVPATTATVGKLYTFTPVGDDVDNSVLTYSIENKPTWATFTEATGELRGTPSSADVGVTQGIIITVFDGEDAAALPAFNLQVVAVGTTPNRAPTITGTPGATATIGRAYSFRPVGSDADGDSLTYSIQNKPAWAQFSTTTGRLWGTPGSGTAGTSARITISVSDGTAPVVSLPSFTIQVSTAANRAPTITGTPVTDVVVGSAYSFTPRGADADGNTLSYRITNMPSWASFNTATGALTGTPTVANVGTTTGIVIAVSDGTALASLPAFDLTVEAIGTGTATVSWTPPTLNTDGTALTDLASYRVVYGRTATNLSQTALVTNIGLSSYTVSNLASGTWYFAVRAVNLGGTQSDVSNVASKTIP